VDGEQGLTDAAGLVHLALDGARGDTWSVELGDQVKVQLFCCCQYVLTTSEYAATWTRGADLPGFQAEQRG
jgi:hypothetical protein